MNGRLGGRTAVVTGAARGIGLGIATRFSREGARLLLVDTLGSALTDVAAELGDAHALVLDVTAADAPARILDAAITAHGRVDILVNNAGIAVSGTIEQFSDEQWDRALAINLTAPFRIARTVVPHMAANGYGRVINISSMNAIIGMRGDAAYAASKAGLEALSRSIAADYGRQGVTANTIAPGTIETPLNRDILATSPVIRAIVDNKPVPGNGHVDDIAAAAVFLASEEAKYVSAQVLGVDGGLVGTRVIADIEGAQDTRYIPKN